MKKIIGTEFVTLDVAEAPGEEPFLRHHRTDRSSQTVVVALESDGSVRTTQSWGNRSICSYGRRALAALRGPSTAFLELDPAKGGTTVNWTRSLKGEIWTKSIRTAGLEVRER